MHVRLNAFGKSYYFKYNNTELNTIVIIINSGYFVFKRSAQLIKILWWIICPFLKSSFSLREVYSKVDVSVIVNSEFGGNSQTESGDIRSAWKAHISQRFPTKRHMCECYYQVVLSRIPIASYLSLNAKYFTFNDTQSQSSLQRSPLFNACNKSSVQAHKEPKMSWQSYVDEQLVATNVSISLDSVNKLSFKL